MSRVSANELIINRNLQYFLNKRRKNITEIMILDFNEIRCTMLKHPVQSSALFTLYGQASCKFTGFYGKFTAFCLNTINLRDACPYKVGWREGNDFTGCLQILHRNFAFGIILLRNFVALITVNKYSQCERLVQTNTGRQCLLG